MSSKAKNNEESVRVLKPDYLTKKLVLDCLNSHRSKGTYLYTDLYIKLYSRINSYHINLIYTYPSGLCYLEYPPRILSGEPQDFDLYLDHVLMDCVYNG